MTSDFTYVPVRIPRTASLRARSAAHKQRAAAEQYALANIYRDNNWLGSAAEAQELAARLSYFARYVMGVQS